MALYAGKVTNDGTWDDNTSLGALLEQKFTALEFENPAPELSPEEREKIIEYNKKIAFQAQAEAIIEHIVTKMEIRGVTTNGKVIGKTKTDIIVGHTHDIDLPKQGEEILFTQNNDGTGLVA